MRSTTAAAIAVSGPAKRYATPTVAPMPIVSRKKSASESTIGQLRQATGIGVNGRATISTDAEPLDFDAVGGASTVPSGAAKRTSDWGAVSLMRRLANSGRPE